jgi:diaminopimelate epimerase
METLTCFFFVMTASIDHIPFTKMQGAGNDFVVIDNRSEQLSKNQIIDFAPQICARKYGVGSDGILVLMPPEKDEADYTMFYRNPDGSDAGMCGNGARCIALFAHSIGFGKNQRFNVHDQIYETTVIGKNTVSVSFPMKASVKGLEIDGRKLYKIHTGTEHLVTKVDADTLENEDFLRKEGRKLRYNKKFQPKGTNVNFICGIEKSYLKLQTYERGVEDLTLACGTGAIASALIWHHLQKTKPTDKLTVKTKGGTLTVYFSFNSTTQAYSNIKLEGPAHFVYEGDYTF